MKKLLLFLLASSALYSQQIDPRTQINWPRVTGSGSPTSAGFACTSSNIGQPYTDNLGPHYWSCTSGGWFQVDGSSGSIVDFKNRGTLLTGAFATNPQIYDYDDTALTPDSGFVNGKFLKNTTTGKWAVEVPTAVGVDMQPQGLPAGQHWLVYPTAVTVNDSNPRTVTVAGSTTWQGATVYPNGTSFLTSQSGSFPPASSTITWTFTGALAGQAPGINPANIIKVVPFTKASWFGWPSISNVSVTCTSSMTIKANYPIADYNVTNVSTAVDTVTCTTGISDSLSSPAPAYLTIGLVGLAVYDSVDPAPPTDNSIQVALPFTLINNTLGLSPSFPQVIHATTVGWAIANVDPTQSPNYVALVGDGPSTAGACGSGGGSTLSWLWTNGSAFQCAPVGSGTGGGDTITSPGSTISVGGTSTNTTLDIALGHANTWTAKQTQPAPVLSDLAGGGTQCVDVDNTGQIGVTGSACGAGGGVGGSGTAGFYALWSASTTLGNGSLDDAVTRAGFVTSSKAFQVVCSSCSTQVDLTYNSGHAPAGASGVASLAPDSSGNLDISENGAAYDRVCTHSNGQCTGGSGGGYTNVTGSASETTVALINTACGSGTYYATTPLSIATGGTLTCPVQFSKAGLWTIASGQNVAFTYAPTETDAPAQHFAGSGTVTLPNQTKAFFEWWGAVGDGSTVDLAAMQACVSSGAGKCFLKNGKNYYEGTSCNLTITTSGVGLAGTANPDFNGTAAPIISCGSTTATMLYMHGTSTSVEIIGNSLENISFIRTVGGGGSAKDLDIEFTQNLTVKNVWTSDGNYGMYLIDPRNARIDSVYLYEGFRSLTNTGNFYSLYLDGSNGNGFFSPLITNFNGGANFAHNSYCAYVTGANGGTAQISDWTIRDSICYGMDHGLYVDGTNGGSGAYASDMHVENLIANGEYVDSFYVKNLAAGSLPGLTILDGQANTTHNTYAVDIESSQGIAISGLQVSPSVTGATTAGIYAHSSSQLTLTGNYCVMYYGTNRTGDCIRLDGTVNSTISGNTVAPSNSSTPTAVGINLVNTSTNNSVMGNTCSGAGHYCIAADATSSNNSYLNLNNFPSSGFTQNISDAGTANEFNGVGGTVTYTTSTTASSADTGKLVLMNCASACSYTLPATQPTTSWQAWVMTVGSTNATIVLGGTDTFNGSTSVPVLNQYRPLLVFANSTTATDYRGDAPLTATSPIVITPSSNGLNISCPTCGTSSATNVTINGGAGLGTANLNDTTPAAGTNGINVKWQNSASNVSAEIVGDGTATHFLNGIGTFTTPAGSFPTPVTVHASATGEVDFISGTNPCFSSSYNDYEIRLSNISFNSSGNIGIQLHYASGWDTGSDYYNGGRYYTGIKSGDASGNQSNIAAATQLFPSQSNDTYTAGSGHVDSTMRFYSPGGNQALKAITLQTVSYSNSATSADVFMGGQDWAAPSSAAADGFRVISTGTFTGTITCQPLAQ